MRDLKIGTKDFLIIAFSLCLSCISSCTRDDVTIPSHGGDLNDSSEYFIVFGDLQEYTSSSGFITYYERSMSWIKEQLIAGARIKSIFQVGDVAETNERGQWSLFADYSKDIAEMVPYFTCAGNHDYTWDKQSKVHERKSTLINEYAHFSLSDRRIVEYYEQGRLENYIAQLPDRGATKLLVLEFGPRIEVVRWAKDYVENHSEDRFILMTHEWLTRYGERVSTGSYAERHFAGYSSFSTPEDIWNTIVKPNNNIICVLCGHNGFSAALFSENDAGRKVPQILFNLQYQENGGNGLIQLWEFPVNSPKVNICAYDTINRDWYMSDSTFVTFNYRY